MPYSLTDLQAIINGGGSVILPGGQIVSTLADLPASQAALDVLTQAAALPYASRTNYEWVPDLPVFDVRKYGTRGDGVTDDTLAVNAAITAAHAAGGGIVFLPAGTYRVTGSGVLLTCSNLILRGAGRRLTTITGTVANLMQVNASLLRQNTVIEDLTLDGQGAATNCLNIDSSFSAGALFIRRCRFKSPSSNGAVLSGVANATLVENIFDAPGTGKGTGITLQSGCRNVRLRHNDFFWLNNGVLVDTGSTTSQTEQVSENITLEGNHFEGGWWLLVPRFTGSGGAVTYAATTLTDTGATFAGIVANDTVRVMPVLQTGTGTFARKKITDASATFLANGIRRGHVVRSGTAFAVVTNAESETVLWVEEWLADSDRSPVDVPATGTYTVFGIILGQVASSTGTVVTVGRWFDLDGVTAAPAAGAQYEVLAHPNYGFNSEYACRNARIINNTFRRCWSDQCSLFGYRSQVIGNLFEDGQDMGLTIHGQHNVVEGNRLYHQGTGAAIGCDDSVVANNVLVECWWVNSINTTSAGAIQVVGNRNLLVHNHTERSAANNHRYGIAISGSSDGNELRGNRNRGATVAGIRLDGAGVTNTRGDFLAGETFSLNSAQIRGTFRGTGSPEGVLTASIGSTYLREDGAFGATYYVKEVGAAATGWQAHQPLPPLRSTLWYGTPTVGTIATVAMTQSLLYYTPIDLPKSITLAQIGIEVTTLAAASTIRLGIYADDGTGTGPGSLIADFGTVDSTTTGWKTITGLSQALPAGRLWLAAVAQGGAPTARGFPGTSIQLGNLNATPPLGIISGYTQSGVTGALPGTAGPAFTGTNTGPRVMILAP